MFCFAYIIILKNKLVKRVFITSAKLMRKKEEIRMIKTQSIISISLFIYAIKFPMNLKYRSSHLWCSLNKIYLQTSQYSQENICVGVSLIKLQASRLATLLKRGSNTGVFLWILQTLRTSKTHLRTAACDSSYILHRKLNKIIEEPDWSFVSFKT